MDKERDASGGEEEEDEAVLLAEGEGGGGPLGEDANGAVAMRLTVCAASESSCDLG